MLTARQSLTAIAGVAVALAIALPARAADLNAEFFRNGNDREVIIQKIINTPQTVEDAIKAVQRGEEVATEVKFESDLGIIYLAVYTTKGLKTDASKDTAKLYRGRIVDGVWRMEGSPVDAKGELARLTEYQHLLKDSPFTLAEIAKKAEGEVPGGKVVWVRPKIEGDRKVFDVGVADREYVAMVRYDLMDGKRL